ncbi:MAG: glycosyltransferase family 4 protein [Thermoplasmata archaeon]|nr:glycosyltransferase family 4 protein [Thermoplasmata archaeon]
MKILMAAPAIMIPESIAQSVHQQQFAKNLVEMGHDLHILCRRPPGRENREGGVTYHRVMSEDFPLKRIVFTLDAVRQLRKLADKERYDIIHDRGYLFGAVGTKVALEKSLPSVLQIDDDWVETEAMASRITATPVYKISALAWCKSLMRKTKNMFAVSETLRKLVAERWEADPDRISVVPNGVELELFSPSATPLGIRKELGLEKKRMVCFVGALGPWHGLENLIRSIPFVLEDVPDAEFVLVGAMKEFGTSHMMEMAKEYGVSDKLHLLGRKPPSEIPGILVESDVAVAPYPARDLGFSPLKLFEYAACGVPIVCSDLPSTREIIENGRNGLLVPPEDEDELAEAITRILIDGRLAKRLSVEGLRRVRSFSWKESTKKLESVYKRALEV